MSIIRKQKQYKIISNDWKYIKRYNNPVNGISRKAQDIMFSALYQIKKYGSAILTHEALTEITETKSHQNCILVKQLGFVLDAVFFRSLIENGKKYRDGYRLTLTKNAEEILANPRQYFAKLLLQNPCIYEKKIADISDKNRTSSKPLLIYKKKEIENDITDLNDHSENQFLNFDVQIEAKEDFVEMPEPQKLECDVEAEVIGLAMDGFCGDVMHSTTTTECAQIPTETAIEAVSETARAMPIATQTQAKMYRYAPTEDRITRIDKNGNEYWGIPLRKYQYSKAMLEEVRLASNKPHFTQERISGLFSYLADKYPDKLIIGGRKGFVEYMTKVVNGEKEYDEANKMISIEEKRRKAQKSMDDMVFNNDKIRYA
jgi:hypothetical protein